MERKKSMTMNRRQFMKTAAALTSVAAVTPASASPSLPNIVIIIADQLNIDAISAYQAYFDHPAWGAHWVKTPNLDRLIRRGTSFLESHSTNPVCSPARSSVFTGRMSTETGITYNNVGIDSNVPNMGQWFSENSNYDCVYCGKWHAGGRWNYPSVDGPRQIPGFKTLPVGGGGTGDIIDYQVSGSVSGFIRSYHQSNPFLIVAGLMNPHDICYWTPPLCGPVTTPDGDPFQLDSRRPILPPNHQYDFQDQEPLGGALTQWSDQHWRNYIYDYYRMVEKMDSDVGRILDAVESRSDDTLVVFTSDHGEGCGRHARVQKWHPYNQSVKVPLIVSCPGRLKTNVINQTHLVSGVDIMSTVCDYAGIPAPPHVRGLSLRPLLSDTRPEHWRDHIFCELHHTCRVIRTQQYKYVMSYAWSGQPDKPYLLQDGTPSPFIRGGSARYQVQDKQLLFDLTSDPWEQHNLARDPRYASVIDEHKKLLLDNWENRLIPGRHFDRN